MEYVISIHCLETVIDVFLFRKGRLRFNERGCLCRKSKKASCQESGKIYPRIDSGDKLVVVIHSSGEREVFKFIKDNDEPASVTTLADEEARQIGAILSEHTFSRLLKKRRS